MEQSDHKNTDRMYQLYIAHHPDVKNANTKEEWTKEQEEIDKMLKLNPEGGKSPSRLQGFEGWPFIGEDILCQIANIADGDKKVPDAPKKGNGHLRTLDNKYRQDPTKTVRRELF
jgi:hypothetical protein